MAEDPRIEAILDVLGPRQQGTGTRGQRLYIFEWGHETTPTDEEMTGLAKKILAAVDAARPAHLRVGDILGRQTAWPPDEITYDGFCGGEFGRDSYDLKRVEKIAGDYVVCRTESGGVAFYSGNPDDLVEYVLPSEAWPQF